MQFLIHMASANPAFGFACDLEERSHRNRVTTQLGAATIHAWVGRNAEKCIPGLYWLTLLPENLLSKHGVSLSAVGQIALEHRALDHGQHLFRFYDRPEDWRYESKVTKLIAALPGIFDVEGVRPKLETAKTLAEHAAITREWK